MSSMPTKGGAEVSKGNSATDSLRTVKKESASSIAAMQCSASDRATAPAPSKTERKAHAALHGSGLNLPPMPVPCDVNEDVELRVLCFNVWGIFNSKKREARMRHFAHKIKNYDLILLQEQFNPNDFEIMKTELSRIAREEDGEEDQDFLTTHGNYAGGYYFQRFRSGFYGCGLAVISRFPIVGTMFHCFPLQGYPERILHGDFFANKGAALVKVAIPLSDGTTRVVHSYTTHLVATYEKISRMASYQQELYLPFRLSQALSFAQFISLTSRPDDLIIVGGDFNANQYTLEVRLFLATLKLQGYKLTSVLHPVRSCTSEREGLHTVSDNNAFNYSKTSYFKLLNLESDHPSQIDHIFYNYKQLTIVPFDECPDKRPDVPPRSHKKDEGSASNSSSSFSDYVAGEERRAVTEDGIPKLGIVTMTRNDEVPLKEDADSASCPLSDHYAVAAKFLLNSNEMVDSPPRAENPVVSGSPYFSPTTVAHLTQDEMATLDEAITFLSTSVDALRQGKERCLYLAGACAAFMLAAGVGVGLLTISQPSAGFPHTSYSGLGDVWHLTKRLFFHTVDAVAPLVNGAVSAVSNSPPPPPRKAPPMSRGGSGASRAGIVAVTTVSHVFCALSGMAALATALMGIIHRQGNANLLEEQLRQLVQTKKVNTLVRHSYEDAK